MPTIKGVRAIVAGTGFEGRAPNIRRFCREGVAVQLRREPYNPYDKDAIAVYMRCSQLFGLWRPWMSIGYVKAARADGLAPKMDSGQYKVRRAYVHSFDVYPGLEHPRVSIQIEFDVRERASRP